MKNRREQGIALITTLLILLLLSTIIVGIAWLVTGDQKLGGNNSDRQLAFYGAEAGMESLTASLENLFDANYSPNATAINALMTNPGPPSNIPNVQYIAPGSTTPGSGYQITFTPSTTNANLPATSWGTIPTGDNDAGLVALMTPYTLTVTARTVNGSEVRLQREVQTVGIPVFQFGFFSQMDLSFFAGPNFNFGGRVHTNGNLWLNEGNGSTLTMSQKVTAAGEIITENLENGWPGTAAGTYGGTVNITNGSGVANLLVQTPQQSVLGNTNYYGNIGAYDTTFKAMANSIFNNNIGVAQTGVQPLNVSIATPAIGGQPIDMIRRPQPNENNTNPAKLVERYYGNLGLSMRILLSDYGTGGVCSTSAISSSATSSVALPNLSPNLTSPATPIDLATLAWDTNPAVAPAADGNTTLPYAAAPGWISSFVGNPVFPLPVSGATGGASYSSSDGYWVKLGYPIITGCIKIEYQSNATPGTWVDVTPEILELGYTGRNINPQGSNIVPPSLPNLPGSQEGPSGPSGNSGITPVCAADPSPNAVIRLARVRDNPSYWGSGSTANECGTNRWPTSTSNQYGTDYWPNVLFDPREGQVRDQGLATNTSVTQVTLAGAMYYVELDVKNLAKWFSGTIGTSGTKVLNTDGYSVYFSDRRGESPDPQPPASVGASGAALTGGYGYEDIVNPASNNGCPNDVLDSGEDVESDYVNGVSTNTATTPRIYGGTPAFDNALTAPSIVVPLTNVLSTVLQSNPGCSGTAATPLAIVATGTANGQNHPLELRENPPLLFRRALKVMDGDTISLGTCNSVPCGLTIASENPVYVQGCYNNPGKCNMTTVNWSTTSVGASIVGDAITLLSDSWNDVNSFAFPWGIYSGGYGVSNGGRNVNVASTTYRMAVAAGKGVPFKQPGFANVAKDYGTDGGAHNFLRYIENWGATNTTLYYEGSIVSLYYNHQAEGLYKCCTVVYSPPARGYQFDTNFLTPSLLPPLTPMLRTVNTIGFTQMLLPTQ